MDINQFLRTDTSTKVTSSVQCKKVLVLCTATYTNIYCESDYLLHVVYFC
jgi:hypothetical protein